MSENRPSDRAIAQAFWERYPCDTHTYEQCQLHSDIIERARDIDDAEAPISIILAVPNVVADVNRKDHSHD